ncbi:hypothetical protein P691DRAFT_658988 [Macrolepiota fuliginosa MF-IS2]|uniref:Phosphatidylinositol N-acetylglucosaminyltransferase subunit H conserved domain-containing protein n=1 Tax=Macrolepiota fuliginosa MF-IS2 TaxID=1400762 RepID=A0A9P5XLV5_9AGAR|nr:hypothetical protein P691DRAFT_658988 [Macrolepiota fuliginosa MF-IS2]
MQRKRPLPSHPEFSVIDYPGYREYRVENFYIARDGSGRVVKRTSGLTWYWILIPTFGLRWFTIWALVTVALLYGKCTQILAETILVIPSHGIQLETTRGIANWPFIVSRHFIPLTALQDVIINEGLRRWNVRFYLAAVKEGPGTEYSLDVLFENTLPRMPILLEVYHGIHELLLDGTVSGADRGKGERGESEELCLPTRLQSSNGC